MDATSRFLSLPGLSLDSATTRLCPVQALSSPTYRPPTHSLLACLDCPELVFPCVALTNSLPTYLPPVPTLLHFTIRTPALLTAFYEYSVFTHPLPNLYSQGRYFPFHTTSNYLPNNPDGSPTPIQFQFPPSFPDTRCPPVSCWPTDPYPKG